MWYLTPAQQPDQLLYQQALQRQSLLTKPHGSLGTLETLACQLAARQGRLQPRVDNIQITIFAGDHGIAQQNVSAYPQIVTAEMVKNFSRGGAAITVLAAQYQAAFQVIDVGVAHSLDAMKNVVNKKISQGTKDFSTHPAMTEEQLTQALQIGKEVAEQAQHKQIELFIGGEMGIANTTSATAILCALLNKPATELTGAGTGLGDEAIINKSQIITAALSHHLVKAPLDVLKTFGGFEIAALVGAYIACAQYGISILVDGFISTTAAIIAVKINPGCLAWMDFAHQSAEKGHQIALKALQATPLLNLNMRLGEGSGAALAIGLLQSACALHNNMSTFAEADISTH